MPERRSRRARAGEDCAAYATLRLQRRRRLQRRPTTRATPRVEPRHDPRRVGPGRECSSPQDLIIAFSRRHRRRRQRLRRRHRRLGLPRRRQRPLRRRPVRPRHRRGQGLDAGGRQRRPGRHLPELHGPAAARRRQLRRRRQPLRRRRSLYATDNGVAGGPGGARRAQQLEPRPRRGRLRLPPRRHGDRLGRRRGRPAQQLALEPAARDPRQLGHDGRRCRRPTSRTWRSTAAPTSTPRSRSRSRRTSCSSNATGLAAGMAGLIYSRGPERQGEGRARRLSRHARAASATDGEPCLITPNEVRQLMASGTIGGVAAGRRRRLRRHARRARRTSLVLADAAARLHGPRTARAAGPGQRQPPGSIGPPAPFQSYPARKGPDQFYGYGRVNMDQAAAGGPRRPGRPRRRREIPPEAEITSPQWFAAGRPGAGGARRRGPGLRARRRLHAARSRRARASTRTTP